MTWKIICTLIYYDDLNLRSIPILNVTSKVKLCYDMIKSSFQWAKLLRSRILRNKDCIRYHIFSSLWTGLKPLFSHVLDNSMWQIGNGKILVFETMIEHLSIFVPSSISLHMFSYPTSKGLGFYYPTQV